MKTLLNIFLVFTFAHSDYIRLWIDEVQYIAPSPSDTEDESVGIEEAPAEATTEEKSSTTKVTNVSDAFDELFNS